MTINTTNIAQDLADRDAFAQDFIKAAKQAGIHHPLSYDKDKFAIDVGVSLGHLTQNLSNVYAEYCAARGSNRKRILINYVLGLKDSLKIHELPTAPFIDVRKALRPLVRSKILTDNEIYTFKGEDIDQFKPTPRQPFSHDANILLGCDMGRTVLQVTQSMLDSWGVSFSEALDIALKNLAAIPRPRFKEIKPGLFTGESNDYYDDSRLLLPKLFAKYCHLDDPVIMIPTNGRIFIADKAKRRAQLDMLYFVGKEFQTSMKFVSTQMYHFVDGKPTEYAPEDDQVLRKLNEIRKPLLQEYSQQQKKVVEKHLIETDNWAYIYSLRFISQSKDDETASVSIWSADMECIFPEADFILVSKVTEADGGSLVHHDPVLPWSDVIEKYGHLLQKLDGFPNLYRAAPFPSDNTVWAEAA
ncbi:hypothetical protein PP715_13985 [Ralstonia solanacearum]|uniref:hypothetical protein n=1 Tax=Ralstonia solanacearum TaxID=305 RepID=UPI0005ABD16C|nr:hypothetical protein [Ralstonia solanacearum]AMP70783.1 hypothetical protein UW163_15620 [Ralstonia solanacearum]MBB6588043.1 hypothetical protein [Ralstonia solanacearum]MCL9840965.1 hypothetical protein [Ralstonia solanacearum]MDB0533541.1 hypothetical protein [Ralstonia solanacearum]MDB0538243.1 hypothetical protein [Ralstonia solanacearum]